jgi:hypothetical protein
MKLKPHERPLYDDTSLEARRVLVRTYQQMSPERKAAIVSDLRRTARMLFESGHRERHPGATDEDVLDAWMKNTLPPDLYQLARSHRDAYLGRSVAGSAEGSVSANADEDSVCSWGLDGRVNAGVPSNHE